MKRLFSFLWVSGLALVVTGCFESKQEFTLNPDGSGKVVHEMKVQMMDLGTGGPGQGGRRQSEAELKRMVGALIEGSPGIEAWRDVTYRGLPGGGFEFKGTAYFRDVSQLSVSNASFLRFSFGPDDAGRLKLEVLDNADSGMQFGDGPDMANMPEEEALAMLKGQMEQMQQMRAVLAPMMQGIRTEAVFHLPAAVASAENFRRQDADTVAIRFGGAEMLKVMDAMVAEEALMREAVRSMQGKAEQNSPESLRMNELAFGTRAPVRVTLSDGAEPLFDFEAELASAKVEHERLKRQLGSGGGSSSSGVPQALDPEAMAFDPLPEGEEIRKIDVAGVRLVRMTDDSRGIRPFHVSESYSLFLVIDLAGPVVSVSNGKLLRAEAGDGEDLLPEKEWELQLAPQLTPDRGTVIFPVTMKVPGPGVRMMREISGEFNAVIAGGLQSVDLGFERLQAGERAQRHGAEIMSMTRETLRMRLNLARSEIKQVRVLAPDGQPIRTTVSGYFTSGGSTSFILSGSFPDEGRVVVDMPQIPREQKIPFKLMNITLTGQAEE